MLTTEELDARLTGYAYDARSAQDQSGASFPARDYTCGCHAEQEPAGLWNLWPCDKTKHQRDTP
jgi:hypothetical protein